jgi:hypothetical protein
MGQPDCTRASLGRLEDVALLIDAEYEWKPCMRLTCIEAARLGNLTRDDCWNVLDYLVTLGRLAQDEDGRYFRFGDMW